MTVSTRLSLALLAAFVISGCSVLESVQHELDPDADRYPDVVALELASTDDDRVFDLAVTISSPYDSAERYADGWRVLDPDGNVLGTHTLMHDHANEQPFTRTQRGLEIPEGVTRVTVEGRDQANGFGGDTSTVDVPEPGASMGVTTLHDGS
jgi:hypothetical protein